MNNDKIPQFHRNRNFIIMLFVLAFLGLTLLMGYSYYKQAVMADILHARQNLIESVLNSYFMVNERYPESLEILVEDGYINQLPEYGGYEVGEEGQGYDLR